MRGIKIFDILIQAMLIILGFVLLRDGIAALLALLAIGGWQLLSAFVHAMLPHSALLRKERMAYWVMVVIYTVAVIWIANMRMDHYITEKSFTVMLVMASAMAIWYLSICAREVMRLYAKPSPEQRDIPEEP